MSECWVARESAWEEETTRDAGQGNNIIGKGPASNLCRHALQVAFHSQFGA